jgi:DNA-binding response OmpR family regulator
MEPISILLVEDEPVVALNVKFELESKGHRVFMATNTAEVIEHCSWQLPDLVILNFYLGGEVDGMEIARLLRTRYLMRVLFITGARRKDVEYSSHFYGGHEVLHKPFTRRQLLATLTLFLQ